MNSFDIEELKLNIGNVLNAKNYRVQIILEKDFITFQIDWVNKNGFMDNLCFSFPYIDLVNLNENVITYICDELKKEIK